MANDPNDFQDLVSQFVLGSIRRPIDTLGVRRTDVSFTDIQEAAAGVFLLNPKAPFYVLYLACQRLLEVIEAEAELIDELMRLLGATGRSVQPVKDLTPLSNITSALLELERAIGQRSEAFKDISDVPAFKRFDDNVQRFLDGPGRNVKDGGELIETPQEAKSRVPNLVALLMDSHAEILRRVRLIQAGLANYEKVNLPALAASGVISRSRQVISQRTASLTALSPIDRLTQNKDTVLELLASRSIVRQFGSFSHPASVFPGDMLARGYVDPAFPGEPSTLKSEKPYYRTQDGYNILDFFLDEEVEPKFEGSVDVVDSGLYEATFTGAFAGLAIIPGNVVYVRSGAMSRTRWTVFSANATTLVCSGATEAVTAAGVTIQVFRAPDDSVQLVNAPNAYIDAIASEPIRLYGTGDDLPETSGFRFHVDGLLSQAVMLIGTTAWDGNNTFGEQVAHMNEDILDLRPNTTVLIEAMFFPPKIDTTVTITSLGGINYRATLTTGDWDNFGLLATGYYLKIITGPDKTKMMRVVALGPSPIVYVDFEAEALAPMVGAYPATERVQIGTSPRTRLRDINPFDAQTDSRLISLDMNYPNSGSFSLGFSEGQTSKAARLNSRQVAEDVMGKGTLVEAEAGFDPLNFTTTSGRSEPLAPTRIVMSKLQGTGSVVAAGLSVTLTTTLTEAQLATIRVNDDVVFRSSNPVNTRFNINSIVGNQLICTGSVAIASQLTIDFEIADAAVTGVGTGYGYTIKIPVGPNSGTYDVTGKGPTFIDFDVTPQLPVRQDIKRDPVTFGLQVGLEYVFFKSATDSINSSVIVHGSAVDEFFFSAPSVRGGGMTKWLLLDALPTGLQVGDGLEIYEDAYDEASDSYEITEVEYSANVIGLDRPVSTGYQIQISQNKTVPFALLRAAAIASTNGLEEKLATWAALPVNQELYFTDLNRFVNPLLVNENPTAVQVADAQTKLKDLYKTLTEVAAEAYAGTLGATLESILDGYNAEHQPPIDTMVKSFVEKGADKAVDILLESDFDGFFGLDVDESSYAGDMMKKMRELAREDLPIRKVERLADQQNQLLASTEDEDFETSASDTNVPKTPTG